MSTKFYHFDQNNSGGSFVADEHVAHNVIIEANNAEHANKLAWEIGIYFNGCDDGTDCSCCGDRWYEADESDGTDTPLIYNEPPELRREIFGHEGEPYCHVYYLDGLKKTYVHYTKEKAREIQQAN